MSDNLPSGYIEQPNDPLYESEWHRRRAEDAIERVRELHRKVPVYETEAGDCEHGNDCDGIELSGHEALYCPAEISGYTCNECAELSRDNMDGEIPDFPCPTIKALNT